MTPKLKPPHHWQRQVAKYARKMDQAKTPTQRSYAHRMKQAAERSLLASEGGVETIEPDGVLDLPRSEYREL